MAGAHQWRGFEVHGFDGPQSLAYSLDNAGHRHAFNFEVCAKLMNGPLYANQNPPADNGYHKEFEKVVVSDDVFIGMGLAGGVNMSGRWLGYKPNALLRTKEQPVTSLKVRHDLYLPCFEINGGSRFRRRIILPPSLVEPGAVVYHFLEYKSLPNMEYRARASVLAEREAAEAVAEANNEAEAEAVVEALAEDDLAPVDNEAAANCEIALVEVIDPAEEDLAPVGNEAAANGEIAPSEMIAPAENDLAPVGNEAAANGEIAPSEMIVAPIAATTAVLLQEILKNYNSSSDEDYEASEEDRD